MTLEHKKEVFEVGDIVYYKNWFSYGGIKVMPTKYQITNVYDIEDYYRIKPIAEQIDNSRDEHGHQLTNNLDLLFSIEIERLGNDIHYLVDRSNAITALLKMEKLNNEQSNVESK